MLPALLLSAALSVPATAVAGNAKNDRAHAAEKAKDHQKQAKQHAKAARQNAQQAQKHSQKAQKQALKAHDQRPVRVVVPQRQVVVVPAEPVYVAQRNGRNRNRWDGWNRGYNKYSTGNFQLDATASGRASGCALVTDHQGQVIPLVGVDPLTFRQGEHVLMSGRIQSNTACGTAFRVSGVERVWNGSNHRQVLFDSRRDGDFFSYRSDRGRDRDRYDDRNSRDRYDDRNSRDRYDDRYDRGDDRYDRDGRNDGRRAISVDGRLDDSGDCPVIRDGIRSECGGAAIEVGEIINR